MKLYNTKVRKVEEFKPKNDKLVTVYTCGPTVYHYAHIGNLRTFIFEDVLVKSLRFTGYKVKRAMNITDVGHLESDSDTGIDKMDKAAARENKTVYEIADYYTNCFLEDFKALNIEKPEILEKASDHIEDYIKMIQVLLEKGYAYKGSNGNIYFDISKYDSYYDLYGNSDNLLNASREDVSVDESKRNPSDFVLWFLESKFKNQIMKWDSPFGVGYPGWHIECSAISIKYLGEYLDIHCGGIDLVFPHHTNEIAQSEAYLGHTWCSCFMHAEHLNTENGKMSKSTGGFVRLEDLKEYNIDPLVYRLFCLNSHYRNQLVFSIDALKDTSNTYNSLKRKVGTLISNEEAENDEVIDSYLTKFNEYISNDLNTANCITLIFDILKEDVNDNTKIYIIRCFEKVLSLDLFKKKRLTEEEENKIRELLEERNIAKSNKDYALADELRDKIESFGVTVKDSREGSKVIL